MKRVENLTVLKNSIIPIEEFIKRLGLNANPQDIAEIEFIEDEAGNVQGIMISTMVVHKHEEQPQRVKS